MTRWMIVDDHPLWAAGLGDLCVEALGGSAVTYPHPRVALEASDPPDVILLDLTFGRETSLPAVVEFRARWPSAPVVIISAHESRALGAAALREGAAAYLSKTLPPADLLAALAAVREGRPVAATGTPPVAGAAANTAPGEMPLTARQRDILQQLVAGATQQQAATVLGISAKTVEYHLAEIRQRTGIQRLALLVQWAAERFARERATPP